MVVIIICGGDLDAGGVLTIHRKDGNTVLIKN